MRKKETPISVSPLRAKKIRSTWVWSVALVATLILGLVFFIPYVFVISLAVLIASLTNPIYQKLKRKLNKAGLAAALTALITLIIVIIPIILIGALALIQLRDVVSSIQSDTFTINSESIQIVGNDLLERVNTTIADIFGAENLIDPERVQILISEYLPDLLSGGVTIIVDFSKSLPGLFTSAIIFIFLYFSILLGQDKILSTVTTISPFEKSETKKYLKRMGAMTNAMFTGQLLISFSQSLVGALSLSLVGYGEYFVLMTLLFTVLNMIPLGSGIITIPVGIIIALSGNWLGGLFVIFTHIFIASNIDNLMRPKLIPKDVQLSAGLTLLSVFAGVYYFGLLGVIYGPVVAIIISTTIETYVELKQKGKIY